MIYTAEKSLREAAGKIDDDLKKDIEAKIAALKKNRDTGASLDELKRASTELSVALSKIGEALQKASSQPGTGAGDPTDNPPPKNNNNGPIRDAETS